MTTFDRFERAIPELMNELAPARVPEYFDDMLRETASHGQRPAWSYPERWLPVEITARPLSARSFPWRPLAILALIALLVAAGLVVYIGSQTRLPSPFGVAGNGVLLYRASDGRIVSLDPDDGSTATVVPASDALVDPVPSRDGRRIVLTTFGSTSTAKLTVRGIDGSNPITLAGDYKELDAVDWSPDGSKLAIVSNVGGLQSITIAATDGSGQKVLSLDREVSVITYLPDGRLALMAGEQPTQRCPGNDATRAPCALFVVNQDGTGLELLIPAVEFHGINTISASPDGSKLLWVEWTTGAEGRLHIFDLSDRVDRVVPDDAFPGVYSMNRAWFSPDGNTILFDFFEADGDHWGLVPSTGGTPIRIGQKFPEKGSDADWSPDGRSVLARFGTSDTTGELWVLDSTGGGADRRLEGNFPYLPPWQRVAR
ncbi:MAG TPA: WD40 repeat domain-containing protein [Candidatus Limnocylindrales bacterium]